MYAENAACLPEGPCAEHAYRLAVYEAGHALTARALGLRILSVRMLPRPPVLISDKTFTHNSWSSFTETLETRVIELYGGQIAEELVCKCNTCGSGDIARIDELCRLIAALSGESNHEDILFGLEDVAQEIFADPQVRAAVRPIAEFFHSRMTGEQEEIEGPLIERALDAHVPPLPKKEGWLRRAFAFGRSG